MITFAPIRSSLLCALVVALFSCASHAPLEVTRDEWEVAATLRALASAHAQTAEAVATMEGSIMELTPEFERTNGRGVEVAIGEWPGEGRDYRVLSSVELEKINQLKALIAHGPRATLAECEEAAQVIVNRLDEFAKLGTALPLEVENPKSRPVELGKDWKESELRRANTALMAALRERELQLLLRAEEIAPASTPADGAEAFTAADSHRISQVVRRLLTFEMKRLTAATEVALAEEWTWVLESRLAAYPKRHVVDRLTFVPPRRRHKLRPRLLAAGQGSEEPNDGLSAASRYWRAAQDHFDGVMEAIDVRERSVMVRDRARADGVRWVAHLEALHLDATEALDAHDALRERLPVPALLKSALRF